MISRKTNVLTGLRLGKMIVKMALVKLLIKYDFRTIDDRELEFDRYGVTLKAKGGINLKVTERIAAV